LLKECCIAGSDDTSERVCLNNVHFGAIEFSVVRQRKISSWWCCLKLNECFIAGLIAPPLVVGPPPPGYTGPPPQVLRVPIDRKLYLYIVIL